MKVALYGNVCNNFYTLAKALRGKLGIDAHLYLHPKVDFQNKPESDDPYLLNNYPDWIHLSDKWNPLNFLRRFDFSFIRELNKYDVVFLSDFGVFLSPFIKGETVYYVTGSDLWGYPFPGKKKYKSLKEKLMWYYIGFMQRRGIRHSKRIFSQRFFPFERCLMELKVDRQRISNSYFPILMDLNVIKKNENAWEEIDEINKNQLQKFNFIVFHPTRLLFVKTEERDKTWQIKGNDVLLRAFKIFLEKNNIKDACLAMPKRFFSSDINEALELINSLGIQDNIVWLVPPNEYGFPRKELMNYYSISDIVADDFNYGMFGSIVVEGMACEKPTLSYVEQEAMNAMYPWHPIISSKDPEKMADAMAEIYFNKEKALDIGRRSREWALQFHSVEHGSEIYLNNFKKEFLEI